jgi:hypothetical protein
MRVSLRMMMARARAVARVVVRAVQDAVPKVVLLLRAADAGGHPEEVIGKQRVRIVRGPRRHLPRPARVSAAPDRSLPRARSNCALEWPQASCLNDERG